MQALDAFLPEYEYSEWHAIAIAAPPERIDAALRAVTLADSPLTLTLSRLRGLRPRAQEPFLAGLQRRGTVLDDAPGEGIVLGLTGQFWRLRGGQEDDCQAVVDFRVADSRLTTETRVHVADAKARRKFGRYWFVIRPFSGLIRTSILRAVKRRAEA